MTRIDFYIRKETTLADRQDFACRLVQKASVLGHRVYIHCASEEDAHVMDKLLWTFQHTSFIPHKLIHTGGAECAIEIGFSNDNNACGEHHDLLVNLSFDIPVFFTRFERLAEIVVQEPKVLEATRSNYRYYTHKNYPLHNHDMRA